MNPWIDTIIFDIDPSVFFFKPPYMIKNKVKKKEFFSSQKRDFY